MLCLLLGKAFDINESNECQQKNKQKVSRGEKILKSMVIYWYFIEKVN